MVEGVEAAVITDVAARAEGDAVITVEGAAAAHITIRTAITIDTISCVADPVNMIEKILCHI
nr:protein [Spodoptera litura nucleopolyhedrovirus]